MMPTPLTIDFETYYDSEYSLAKMPTAQYVRDSRFKVEGAAVGTLTSPVRWYEPDALRRLIASLPWADLEIVAHNASFDALILTEHYHVRPARYACTVLMLRYLIAQGVLDPEQGTSLAAAAPLVNRVKGDLAAAHAAGTLDEYATTDAEICRALYETYWSRIPDAERDYISMHVQMAVEPAFALDTDALRTIARQDAALEEVFPLVRQDDTFAAALTGLGVHPRWKTTPKGTYKLATAKTDGWLATLLDHDDPRVRLLAEARQKAGSTIERSRAQRFIDVGAPLPVPLLYYGAHTGRASGDDNLNLQNLPRKGALRSAIKAPPGHVLVVVDSAQIEVRVLAWLADDDDLLDTFRRGDDPYVDFARTLYGVTDVTPAQRQVAKAAVLALGFGQGAPGFTAYCERFGIDLAPGEASRVVTTYRQVRQPIVRYWRVVERQVKSEGEIVLPSGRKITYPRLRVGEEGLEYHRHAIFRRAKKEGHTSLWHGKIVENCVQATARDVAFAQTRRLWRAGWRVALMVHDETVLLVPEDRAEEARHAAEVAFGSAPVWAPRLPTAGEARAAREYGK